MPQGETHAAHVQRFQGDRLETLADHEFGGAAANIHHQLLPMGIGQSVSNAHVNQARLLPTGNNLDRKAEGGLGLHQEVGRVLGHAQGVGCHRPHGIR